MQFMKYALAVLLVAAAAPAHAQEWFLYVNTDDHFSVNFPEEPTIEETTVISQRGDTMPMRIYRASDGVSDYSVTVIDYTEAVVSDVRGSIAWEAWKIRQEVAEEGGEITFDGYAQVDRIEGHQLQITNADESHTFYGMHLHMRRLYILEATTPANVPLPMAFQVSLSMLDPETNEEVRYTIDADGQRISDD